MHAISFNFPSSCNHFEDGLGDFPIRKVQGFSTSPLFLGRHCCLSCDKISQPGLVYKLQTQPQCTCIYSGKRCGRSHHMQWCHVTSGRQECSHTRGGTRSLQYIWGCVDQFRLYQSRCMMLPYKCYSSNRDRN